MKTCRFYGKECGCNCDGHDESCEIFVPLTNADRIRSMSDDELEKELTDLFYNAAQYTNAKDYIANWLKTEVSE